MKPITSETRSVDENVLISVTNSNIDRSMSSSSFISLATGHPQLRLMNVLGANFGRPSDSDEGSRRIVMRLRDR
jgi:hypothetical protein